MDKTKGLHPILIQKSELILKEMSSLGCPMKIIAGLRSAEEQAKLYAQGRTLPGPIVTKCDGIQRKSNHQAQSDGFGHAIDMAFQGPDPFLDKLPKGARDKIWASYGAAVKRVGLKWGGDWGWDKPHAELDLEDPKVV